jgi:hypothetical protein
MGVRNGRWDGLFIGKVHHQLSDKAADIRQPYRTFCGLCIVVQMVSHTSRYYPNCIPKSSLRPVVPHTPDVLFAEHMSSGPPVHPH